MLPGGDNAPTLPGMGSKGQNSTFSEHGQVAYQIKGNHKMQQHMVVNVSANLVKMRG